MNASERILTKAAATATVTTTVAAEPAIPLWARVTFSAAGLVLLGWFWRTFVQRAIDNAGLDGARRNAVGWRAFVRDELLKAEIDANRERDEQIGEAMTLARDAHAIARANADVLNGIAGGVSAMREEQRDFRREIRRAIRDAQHGKYQFRTGDLDDDTPIASPEPDEPDAPG